MPGIRRVKWWDTKVGNQIPREHDPDVVHTQYCQSCLQYGIRVELKSRLYRVDSSDNKIKLVPEIIPEPDADCFRQCYRCGDITPIYNVKQESSLVDIIEPSLNPFDDNADRLGFTSRTSRLAKSKSKYKRKKAQLDSIKDDDLKRELSDGSTLVHYFEK